jgi:hypothetical protein
MDIYHHYCSNPHLFENLDLNYPPLNPMTGEYFWTAGDPNLKKDTFEQYLKDAGIPNKMTIDLKQMKFAFDFNDYPKTGSGALDDKYNPIKPLRDSLTDFAYEFDPYEISVITLSTLSA